VHGAPRQQALEHELQLAGAARGHRHVGGEQPGIGRAGLVDGREHPALQQVARAVVGEQQADVEEAEQPRERRDREH
jgi:hypothetical protein